MLGIPCITLRDNTEWVETVEEGWNILVGANSEKIKKSIKEFEAPNETKNIFGDGNAAREIKKFLE